MKNYEKSLKALKDKLNKDKNLSKEEWDIYAKNNYLYSSNTIYAHEDVLNWEQLKNGTNLQNEKDI